MFFSHGIYKYKSIIKTAGNLGLDIVTILVAGAFGILTHNSKKSNRYKFWQVGTLAGLFYYSACLVFGVTFNSLFPLYEALFSSTLF